MQLLQKQCGIKYFENTYITILQFRTTKMHYLDNG